MKRECFIIPTKIDTPSQSFYIYRCLESIRAIYPDTLIVIALSKGTSQLNISDTNTIQVENPYFSTLGCIYLFYVHKYAEYAYILHDSMVVINIFPTPIKPISFIYTFNEPGMSANVYGQNYTKLLSPMQCHDMITKQRYGCFGVSMGLRHDIIEKLNIFQIIPRVVTKNDFCAMERIFAYLCKSNGIEYDVICGDIFGETNPWSHPEFASMSLHDIKSKNYKVCVVKSLVGRTE